jgi:hypothetical protein
MRTRSAFEAEAYDQGALVTYVDPSGRQLGHEESIADTAQVLGRMYDARHAARGRVAARDRPGPPPPTGLDHSDLRERRSRAAARAGAASWHSTTSTPDWSARSSTTSNMSAATAPAPATPGSPRSTRCSASRPCIIPSTRQSSSTCWRSPSHGSSRRRHLPHRARSRRAARRPEPRDMDRPARPHLLLLAVQAGLRGSELTGLDCGNVHLGTCAHISCHGKRRRNRATPLSTGTAVLLHTLLQERREQPSDPGSVRGRGLSHCDEPCEAHSIEAGSWN